MRRLSARPHHVGSPYDKDNAEWLLAQLKSYGLDAGIEQFEALFPTPKSRRLELLGPDKFTAKLEEPTLSVDPTSGHKNEQLPTYNSYSKDGDVTAPLVYVNYGAPADYEQLDAMGVSVKGAIVIARYGETWRGIKPKVAAEQPFAKPSSKSNGPPSIPRSHARPLPSSAKSTISKPPPPLTTENNHTPSPQRERSHQP